MERVVVMMLAGGQGKRMDALCYGRPKPALPFGGRHRVIDFTLSNCVHSQIRRMAALLDYRRLEMAGYLERWQTANRGGKIDVLMPRVGSYAGTADAAYQNLAYLDGSSADEVLVLAGDHIYQMDYRYMVDFHRRSGADLTIGVVTVPIEQAHRFGIVTADNAGRVLGFVEKPEAPPGNLTSMGIYVFNRRVLAERLAEDADCTDSPHDFGYAIIPNMVRRDRVFAYRFDGFWQDIGSIESYYQCNMQLTGPRPALRLEPDWPVLSENLDLPPAVVTAEGSALNSIVSPGCVIKGHVVNSVLSPGVRVEPEAVVRDSVLLGDVTIGYHSVVDTCVIDESARVEPFCYVGFGTTQPAGSPCITVLGRGVVVPSGRAIGRRCRVQPEVGPADFEQVVVPPGTVVSRRVDAGQPAMAAGPR
jgi:glucose-1-phosphate adenylyltransferase